MIPPSGSTPCGCMGIKYGSSQWNLARKSLAQFSGLTTHNPNWLVRVLHASPFHINGQRCDKLSGAAPHPPCDPQSSDSLLRDSTSSSPDHIAELLPRSFSAKAPKRFRDTLNVSVTTELVSEKSKHSCLVSASTLSAAFEPQPTKVAWPWAAWPLRAPCRFGS